MNGINLYAYCLNNPVNDTDSNGDMPDWLKWLLGGLAFIGAIVLTVVSGGSLAPVFIGMGVSIVGSGLIQGAITASSGGSFWSGFASGAADGAMWGGIFAFAGAAINTIKYFATTTKLYRAVSTAEYQSIKNTGKFSLKIGAFEGKQFGFKLNEVRKYANLPFNNGMYSKIVAVRVPKAELNAIMQKTFTDAFVFKSGIETIIDMDALNAIIKTIRYLNL